MTCRRNRFIMLTIGIIMVPLALAAKNPSLSARAYALTGATGVCIVCYIIPIIAHFKLLLCAGGRDTEDDTQSELLANGEANTEAFSAAARHKELYSERPSTLAGWALSLLLPLVVLVIGCSFSALALWSSLA